MNNNGVINLNCFSKGRKQTWLRVQKTTRVPLDDYISVFINAILRTITNLLRNKRCFMKTLIWATLAAFLIVGVVGCTCPGPAAPKPAPAPKPTPAPAPKAGTCGNYMISQDYMLSGAVRLEKVMPATVQLNAPFEYTINVTNLTSP